MGDVIREFEWEKRAQKQSPAPSFARGSRTCLGPAARSARSELPVG